MRHEVQGSMLQCSVVLPSPPDSSESSRPGPLPLRVAAMERQNKTRGKRGREDWTHYYTNPDRFDASKRKSKMCKFHLSGQCKRGTECAFAHSWSEVAAQKRRSRSPEEPREWGWSRGRGDEEEEEVREEREDAKEEGEDAKEEGEHAKEEEEEEATETEGRRLRGPMLLPRKRKRATTQRSWSSREKAQEEEEEAKRRSRRWTRPECSEESEMEEEAAQRRPAEEAGSTKEAEVVEDVGDKVEEEKARSEAEEAEKVDKQDAESEAAECAAEPVGGAAASMEDSDSESPWHWARKPGAFKAPPPSRKAKDEGRHARPSGASRNSMQGKPPHRRPKTSQRSFQLAPLAQVPLFRRRPRSPPAKARPKVAVGALGGSKPGKLRRQVGQAHHIAAPAHHS